MYRKVLEGGVPSRDELVQSGHPELVALGECPQTQCYHAEGDVAAHTSLVLEQVERILPRTESSAGAHTSSVLRLAGLFHDLGKPARTVERQLPDGTTRYPAKGHAEEGAKALQVVLDREAVLWNLPLGVHVAVHSLVRNHMWPHGIEDVSPGAMLRASHLADPRLLTALWEADTLGRVCNDPQSLAEKVEYAQAFLEEAGAVLPDSRGLAELQATERVRRETLRAVVTGHVSDEGAAQAWAARRERYGQGGSLTYTVGLPGVGKSTWARAWAERTGGVVLSAEGARRRDRKLARIRQLEGVTPVLRDGGSVLVDATNLRREARDHLLAAALLHGAEVRCVYFHSRLKTALGRQRTRPWDAAVPDEAIVHMRRESRFPSPDEYQTLLVVEEDGTEWEYTPETRFAPTGQERADPAVR